MISIMNNKDDSGSTLTMGQSGSSTQSADTGYKHLKVTNKEQCIVDIVPSTFENKTKLTTVEIGQFALTEKDKKFISDCAQTLDRMAADDRKRDLSDTCCFYYN